jgi:hypothetical protein
MGSGHFEPRTIDLIDLEWIPAAGPYCFTHRVIYIDHETWVPLRGRLANTATLHAGALRVADGCGTEDFFLIS